MSEGLVISSEFLADDDFGEPAEVVVSRDGKLEDEANYYGISISFWGFGPYDNGKLPLWNRIKCAWNVLKTGHPWLDMVMLKPDVAKSFAYRILYMLEQIEAKLAGKKDEIRFVGITIPAKANWDGDDCATTAFPLKESQDGSSGDAQQGSVS
jgi:hypothetical protein